MLPPAWIIVAMRVALSAGCASTNRQAATATPTPVRQNVTPPAVATAVGSAARTNSRADQEDLRREWVTTKWYLRFRERLEAKWDPTRIWPTLDPDGRTLGRQDRITVVITRILTDGALDQVEVAATSGVPALDELALQALRDAAPIAPPPSVVPRGADGFVHVTLSFIFEVQKNRSRVVGGSRTTAVP